MALIRCPNCDTLHDLDDAFLATGRRKVRCASCRTVFEADESESDTAVTVAMPLPEPKAPVTTNASAPPEIEPTPPAEPPPEVETPEPAEASAVGEDISADDLEALFADSAPAASPAEDAADPARISSDDEHAVSVSAEQEPPEFDPTSLARAQDAAASAARDVEKPPGERRARRGAGTMRKVPPPPSRLARSGMLAAMVMAAGIGTFSVLVMLREDAVRLFPATAVVFDAVGLSASTRGLDIVDVQSLMVMDDGNETLEVSGRVVNNAKRPLKLPVLRLAIRGSAGAELYVWTATADVSELGPGESTRFSRRLASPPAESQSVMVRFVAKDDIVAAIR